MSSEVLVPQMTLDDQERHSPMHGDIAVSVCNLGKMYHLYDRPQDRLKQTFLWGRKKLYREFWALRNVSFEVRRGEMLGIIGRNGAGKSTILQILAGTLPPTTGEVQIKGRVAALLELGSGFNPEFTGRENVYLNGTILGFSREEMDERFEEIAVFADIGEFIEQPVKLYSSGMYVRLAFAVQACLEPDVLIVDEALGVGDVFFQQKCHARMEKLLEENTAVVLVTHDMGAVQKYCKNAILLEKGQPIFKGSSSEAIKRYYTLERSPGSNLLPSGSSIVNGNEKVFSKLLKDFSQQEEISFWPDENAFINFSSAASIGEGWARCTGIALCDAGGNPCCVFQHGQRAHFYYEFEALQDLLVPFGVVTIANSKNITVHGKATYQYLAQSFPGVSKGTRVRFLQSIVLHLRPGKYTFSVGLNMMKPADYAYLEHMSVSEIQAKVLRLNHIDQAGAFSIMPPIGKVALNHFGICDLPGDCEIGLFVPKLSSQALSGSEV
jgi:lipopolysaccharide transport system ATP-binding protein